MTRTRTTVRLIVVFAAVATFIQKGWAQKPANEFRPAIPKTWDDAATATLEVPLANPIGSPKHVSADYYYKLSVRTIYKSYPVYAPGHEPPGYIEWLKQQEPVVIWDGDGHRPTLRNEEDWIKAGEIVFDAPIGYGGLFAGFPRESLYVREPEFYSRTGTPVAADGTVPFYRYAVTKKGQVKSSTTPAKPGNSMHQVGLAVDFRGGGKLTGFLGDLTWGGAFRSPDPGHFQMAPPGTVPNSAMSQACGAF